MSKQMLSFALVVFVIALAFKPVAKLAAQDQGGTEISVDLSKVPVEVQATAKKLFAKLEDCTVTKEVDEGVTTFAVRGKSADGSALTAKICANGRTAELDREVGADALPAEARTDLVTRFPGAKTVKVESVEIHYFDVQLEKDGKRIDVAVGASGKVFEDESGDEEGAGGEEPEKK